MAKVIAWVDPDGELRGITRPVEPMVDETEAQYLDRVAAYTVATDNTLIGYRLSQCTRLDVDEASLPANRRFRACWRPNNGVIIVPLARARLQLIAELRAERNRRLAETVEEKLRLEEVGTNAQRLALVNYRQALRGMTDTVQAELEAITTVGGLESYSPAWPVKPF